MKYIQQILEYQPDNEQEEKEKSVILNYIEQFPQNILLRDNVFAHISSSGFIMNTNLDKVLMIHHKIYDTWTWTGGHADGDTDLLHIALKEAREETGVTHIQPLFDKIASLDILPVWGHEKNGEYVATHLHLNLAYILMTDEKEKLKINHKETNDLKWIPIHQVASYSNEPYLITIYDKLIRKALGTVPVA